VASVRLKYGFENHRILAFHSRDTLTLKHSGRSETSGFKSFGFEKMKPYDLKSMSVDELLSLHEFVSSDWAAKYQPKKHGLIKDCASSVWVPCLGILR
jgi:hypothetical protein